MTKKKKYRPSTATIEARTYQIYGSREMWLAEQKRIAKIRKTTRDLIHVKGHYRNIRAKKVWIKPYNRKKRGINLV